MLSSFRSRAVGSVLSQQAAPILTLQQRFRYKEVNPRLNDPYENDEAQDQDKIKEFLGPMGLANYAEKFKSWDHMLNTRSLVLKHKFGMNVKERKLLRKKANNWRLIQYYMTGIPYQYKYDLREKVKPTTRNARDDTSEDEMSFVLPTAQGMYLTHLQYPGAPQKLNKFVDSYQNIADRKFWSNYLEVEEDVDKILEQYSKTPEEIAAMSSSTDTVKPEFPAIENDDDDLDLTVDEEEA